MKLLSKVTSLVGLDEVRKTPPPAYHTIADGLLITDTKAEAWYSLSTANLDIETDAGKLISLDRVMVAASKALEDRQCHLKILWGRIDGNGYLDSVQDLYDGGMGNGEEWAQMWAERVDDLGLPERHLMLGVVIEKRGGARTGQAARKVNAALDENPDRLSDIEMTDYFQQARRIMKALSTSPLKARMASAESIAWMISRETARIKNPVPKRGQITGAQMSHLVASKVIPFADHVRLYNEAGKVAMYGAILPIIDFPEEMTVPGEGEWLQTLSDISKIAEIGRDEDGDVIDGYVPVFADASIRFQGVPRRKALKMVDEARRSAKEQRKSAEKHSTGEVSPDIEDAEAKNEALITDIRKSGTSLVTQHPRLVITATTKEELDDNIQAVQNHYLDRGITVGRGEDEQRDLWLEMLPGDTLRVTDLGQTQTDVAFWGSFFWAGSVVGEKSGGMAGYTTGTTTSLFRPSILGGGKRGDRTTTAYVGVSGVGKSTAMGLEIISEMLTGPGPCHVTMPDFKGDLTGFSLVAQAMGIDSECIQIGPEYAGAFDMFRVMEPAKAPGAVQRIFQLQAADARHIDIAASSSLKYAVQEQTESRNPTTYGVIQRMMKDEEKAVREFGQYLADLSKGALGAILLGAPQGKEALTTEPGFWMLQIPNLTLPPSGSDPSDWDAEQRMSLALMQCVTTYCMSVSSSKELRQMRKLVAVPEVHLMLKAYGGPAFLESIARMGRAFDASLAIDTQDCTSIAEMDGIIEQLQGVRVFRLTSEKQQDAAAKMLGMDPSAQLRSVISSLAYAEADDTLHKGLALVMDWRGEVATVQYDYPSAHIANVMSTNPDADVNREKIEAAA